MWSKREQKKPSRKGFLSWLKETKRISIIEQFSMRNAIDTIGYYSVMKKVTKTRLVEISDPTEAKRAIEALYLLSDFDSWNEKNDGKFRYVLSLYSEYLKIFGVSVAEETDWVSVANDSAIESENTTSEIEATDDNSITETVNPPIEYSANIGDIIPEPDVEPLDESAEEHKSDDMNAVFSEEVSVAELSYCTEIVPEDDQANILPTNLIPVAEENETEYISQEKPAAVCTYDQIEAEALSGADSDPSSDSIINVEISMPFEAADLNNTDPANDSSDENMDEALADISDEICAEANADHSEAQGDAPGCSSEETEFEALLNMGYSSATLHDMGYRPQKDQSSAKSNIPDDNFLSDHTIAEEILDVIEQSAADQTSEDAPVSSEDFGRAAVQNTESSVEAPASLDMSNETDQRSAITAIRPRIRNDLDYTSDALGMTLGEVLTADRKFTMGDFCGMNPKDYLEVLIDELDISDQAYRKIQRVCFYIDDLLRVPVKTIFELRGVDLKILVEVLSSLSDYSKKDVSSDCNTDEDIPESFDSSVHIAKSSVSPDPLAETEFEELFHADPSSMNAAPIKEDDLQDDGEHKDAATESTEVDLAANEAVLPAEHMPETASDAAESIGADSDSEEISAASSVCEHATAQCDEQAADEYTSSDEVYVSHQSSKNAIDNHEVIDSLECNPAISEMTLDEVLNSRENFTLGEFCGLDSDLYQGIPITELNLSTRAHRIMRSVGLHISDILAAPVKSIFKMSGMGRKSLTEVVDSLITYSRTATLDPSRPIQATSADENDGLSLTLELMQYQEALLNGEWNAIDESSLSAASRDLIRAYQEAHEILGTEMVQYAARNKSAIRIFSEGVDDFSKLVEWQTEVRQQIANLPAERRTLKARGFIAAYFSESPETKRNAYEAMFGGFDGTLEDFQDVDEMPPKTLRHDLSLFLNWCNFDLADDISEIIQSMRTQERAETVLKARAQGKTLQEIGEMMDITRERVRQIEVRVIRRLRNLISRQKLLLKISALRNADTVLTAEELQEYFGDDSDWLIYLLSNTQDPSYSYGKTSRIFTIGSESMIKRAKQYVESLPDLIYKANMESILEAAEQEEGLPGELIERQIMSSYKQTNAVYHRNSLTLSYMCAQILQKHYLLSEP